MFREKKDVTVFIDLEKTSAISHNSVSDKFV